MVQTEINRKNRDMFFEKKDQFRVLYLKEQHNIKFILRIRLKWAGHLYRLNQERIKKKKKKRKQDGRKAGWPNLKMLTEDARNLSEMSCSAIDDVDIINKIKAAPPRSQRSVSLLLLLLLCLTLFLLKYFL